MNEVDASPVFPVVEFQVGDNDYRSKAPWGDCELAADDYDGQRENSELLKRLELLCDIACAELDGGSGFTVGFRGTPCSGYMASHDGFERRVSPDRPYSAVYQFLFDHRAQLDCNAYVGGWVYDGELYLDVCKHFADRDEAIKFGYQNNQLAIFDIANGAEITL